jgi:transposase
MPVPQAQPGVAPKTRRWVDHAADSAPKFTRSPDAPGNPLDFILTGGQVSDIGQAEALLQLTPEGAQALAADKGYDSDQFVAALEARGMEAIIPPRVNRISPRECDWFAYKKRHLIECFFGKIKHYRRTFRDLKSSSINIWGFCDSLPYSSGCDSLCQQNLKKQAKTSVFSAGRE